MKRSNYKGGIPDISGFMGKDEPLNIEIYEYWELNSISNL